jgi:hypothetical protein
MCEWKKDIKSGGDPCLWMCFPCLLSWMLCEKGLQSCCMCICCMTRTSQEEIIVEEMKEEIK